jgi:putative heme-binding domain-containing protein
VGRIYRSARKRSGFRHARSAARRIFQRAAALALLPLALAAQSAPLADAAAGKLLFEQSGCLGCHAIENLGGSLGPDLSEVGVMRSPDSLRLALTDPGAEIFPEHFTIVVVTNRGERVQGVRLNEDDVSIQLRDSEGTPRSFVKDRLKSFAREIRSLMPSYAGKLSPAEIANVVAYLRTLRGDAVPPAPAKRIRDIAPASENLDWLTRPDRDEAERPETVLDTLAIPEGARVADLGAGAGYFTWRLARRVGPKGKVYAIDIQQKMLDLIAQDLKKRNISNVDLVLGTDRDPGLPAGLLDLVLLANSYHEFEQPEAMLAAVRQALKPDGRMVVLEYRKEEVYTPVPGLHNMSLQELRAEIEPHGFQLDRTPDVTPEQHFLIFTKRQ